MRARIALLQLYRLGVLLAVAWLIRAHHTRLRVEGDRPVRVEEVAGWFTNAAGLRLDLAARGGFHVFDRDGAELGYLIRTLPQADRIIGYCGITDTLVALDREGRVLGFKIRHSEDTKTHVGDVMADRHFKQTWNGMTWEQVAGMDLKKAGVEGVSGATMTSLAVAEGIVHRFRVAQGEMRPPTMRVGVRDFGLMTVLALGAWLTFTKREGRERWRRWFQWLVIGYVGLLNGDLLAQSLLAGWAKSGMAWRMAPGLVLFAAAAFAVPWVARRPLYCQQLCPHGAAQEIVTRLAPARWRVNVPAALDRALLDFDLAGLEAFDAYLIRSAGGATIAVAIAGLLAALCVPKAYCKYGCPTGALLEFVRARGAGDKFGRRDLAAGVMLLVAFVMHWQHAAIHALIFGPAA
ncbi:MAG: FMN-binding domain protein [Limisphaerales bacterium]|nr:MAG: FMN-binding domain protein [Limisphaerales bacterium]KAG0507765.1 MAG: FMN-binding domain protein [Limisphaerales bacterium]